MPESINAHGITEFTPALLFAPALIDDGNPIPWICADRNPCLHGKRIGDLRGILGSPLNRCGFAVKSQTFARDAIQMLEEARDLVVCAAYRIARHRSIL